jgi:hypothetical protein
MAKFVFKKKEGGEFELITPGVYDLMVVKAEIVAGRDDEPQLAAEFEIAEGPEAGKKIPQWFGSSDKRGWVIGAILDAANVPYEVLEEGDDNNPPTISFDTEDLLGRYVRADLTHFYNEKKDQTYHNLKKWEASPLQAAAEGSALVGTKLAEAPKSETKPADAPAATTQQRSTTVRRGQAPARG